MLKITAAFAGGVLVGVVGSVLMSVLREEVHW